MILYRLFARRYLFSSRLHFVPILAWVTFSGIALGVFFLVVVLSIMRGFQEELSSRWIGLNAHLTLTNSSSSEEKLLELKNLLMELPEIEEVQHFKAGEVILQVTRDGKTDAVAAKLRGVDFVSPYFLKKVALYPHHPPNWEISDKGIFSLLAGSELLETLGIHPDFLEKVTLVYPYGEIGPTGDFVPSKRDFIVSHAFETGLYAWDAYTLFVPLREAKVLLGKRGEEGLNIRLHHFSKLQSVQKKIQALLPPSIELSSFVENNKRLYMALKLERLGMMLLLFLFLLIASFSVIGLLLMFLASKRKDFAILQALGLGQKGVQKIYLSLGMVLGALGALTGSLLGILVCLLLSYFPVRLPETYYLSYLPVRLEPFVILTIFFIGCLLAFFSSWYPAFKASRLEILPLLREE